MEFITENLTYILVLLLAISEFLGNTKLVKENSILETIVDIIKWFKERAK